MSQQQKVPWNKLMFKICNGLMRETFELKKEIEAREASSSQSHAPTTTSVETFTDRTIVVNISRIAIGGYIQALRKQQVAIKIAKAKIRLITTPTTVEECG